ncbi:putative retrotransposon protein [Tanacetum coccineum]
MLHEYDKAAWKAEYKIHYDVACLMLGKMSHLLTKASLKYIFPKASLMTLRKCLKSLKAVEIYDFGGYLIQLTTQTQENPSFNKDFVDFVRNFNMHCVGKTVSELHALLIDYEKGLKDKAPTPQIALLERSHAKCFNLKDFWKVSNDGSYENANLVFMGRGQRNLLILTLKGYLDSFKVFKSEVELQLGKKIKLFRSDRGGEYLSQEFKDYLGKNGIVQHLTSPYTPQQNGVSERRNRTLLDMGYEAYVQRTQLINLQQRSVKIFLNESHILRSQWVNYDLEDDHMDTLPSKNTSVIPVEPEIVRSKWNFQKEDDMDVKYTPIIKPRHGCKAETQTMGLSTRNQASRQWNKRFDEEIKKFGFTQNCDEPCVYRKLWSYVAILEPICDDLIIMETIPRLRVVKDYLGRLNNSPMLRSLSSKLIMSHDEIEDMTFEFCFALILIQRISLTGFPAQSVGSSNTDVLESPCLLVLITGTSQSRQHSRSIESCKSPTKSLFDVGSSRISIFTVNT